MFRSLANFVSHKRSFCQLRYDQSRHKDYRESAEFANPSVDSTAQVVIVPEDPVETIAKEPSFDLQSYSPTIELMKEAGIMNEIENKALFTHLNKGIETVSNRLRRKADKAFDTDFYVSKRLKLEHMKQTSQAVFQTHDLEGSSMGENYLAWQKEKQLATVFLGPDGKALDVGDTPSIHSDSSKENDDQTEIINKVFCPLCKVTMSFNHLKSLKRHLIKRKSFLKS